MSAVGFLLGFLGIGTIELRTSRDACIVRNPCYYGWGIHLSLDGWIYNVSGRWAVRLETDSACAASCTRRWEPPA